MSKSAIRSVFSIALAFSKWTPSAAKAQLAFAGGCSIILQQVHNSTVEIHQNACGDEFRVKYFWLDAFSLALIRSGNSVGPIEQVLGTSPKLLKAGVYDTLDKILRIGSVRLTGTIDHGPYNGDADALPLRFFLGEGDKMTEGTIPAASVSQDFYLFTGEETILWPDLAAYEFYGKGVWPESVAYCYPDLEQVSWMREEIEFLADEQNIPGLLSTIQNGITFAGFVDRTEFGAYWSSIRNHVDLINSGSTNIKLIDPVRETLDPSLSNGVLTRQDWVAATPSSYKLISHLTQESFPPDFLLKFGRYFGDNGCGGVMGLNFSVVPRQLRVLVAVIEPVSASLAITGLGFSADPMTGLRTSYTLVDQPVQPVNVPELKAGESYLLPLRIEFQYDFNGPPFDQITNPSQGQAYFELIEGLRTELPQLLKPSGANRTGATGTLAGLAAPGYTGTAETYYFGRVLSLQTLTTRNVATGEEKKREIRETPRVAMFIEAGLDGGSCPFLEFIEADGQLTYHGRVLVGAAGQKSEMIDTIAVPTNATHLIFSEREPEISHFTEIRLRNTHTGAVKVLARNILLNPQESLRLPMPRGVDDDTVVEISGYYDLLN